MLRLIINIIKVRIILRLEKTLDPIPLLNEICLLRHLISNGSKQCSLCLAYKYAILTANQNLLLNKR